MFDPVLELTFAVQT